MALGKRHVLGSDESSYADNPTPVNGHAFGKKKGRSYDEAGGTQAPTQTTTK